MPSVVNEDTPDVCEGGEYVKTNFFRMFTKRLDRIHENYAKICINFAGKELVENLQRNDKKCKNAKFVETYANFNNILAKFLYL